MALTLRHWVMAATLGCGCLAVGFLPPKPRGQLERYPSPAAELRERYQISNMLRAAELELRERRLVLAIDSMLPGQDRRSTIPVVLPVGLATPAERDSFSAQMSRLWPSELAGADSIPLFLVLQGDRTSREWRSTYLLPDRQGEHACVTALRTNTWTEKAADAELLNALLREMGPCLFYRTYGEPGQWIDRWIRGYGLPLATRYDLSSGPRREVNPEAVLSEIPWLVYATTTSVRRCLKGDPAECAKSIVGPAMPEVSAEPRRLAMPEWYFRLPLGSASAAWLSDLQRSMGTARFSRFWHSSQPVEQAFLDAFGVDLGAWTRKWVSESYPGTHPGPLPGGRSAAYASGIMLCLIGLAAVVAKRRTAG